MGEILAEDCFAPRKIEHPLKMEKKKKNWDK
jgi:hypothetical protein